MYIQVFDAFELRSFGFGLYKQRNQKDEIVSSRSKTVQSIGIKHGDMLYVSAVNGTVLWDTPSTSSYSSETADGNYEYKNLFI